MTSTFTTNKNLEKPANGDDVGTWNIPVNADWDAIDAAFGGFTGLNVTSVSGTVVLSATQYIPPVLYISGTLTADVNYQFPAGVGGLWIAVNNATGPYTVTFSSGGAGNTEVIVFNTSAPIFCDGTNVFFQTKIPALAGGINQEIQYNNSGALAGSPNLTFDGTNVGIGGALTIGSDLLVDGAVTQGLTFQANAQTTPAVVAFSPTAMTINCDLSNVFSTTFTANVTTAPTLTSLNDGQTINWFITQDATGGRTMTWPTSFKWPGGSVGVLSTAANAVDLLVATYRSATGNWYASLAKNFS